MLRTTLIAVAITAALAVPVKTRSWDENGCGWSSYKDAGREPNTKIVGGWETRVNEFPYQVSILWYGSHSCGGSIISPTHILTAAHCVDGDDPRSFQVLVGGHRRNDDSGKHALIVDVVRNDWHRDYDATGNTENDIAILTLAKKLTFNDGVQPICAPSGRSASLTGRQTTVSGWGRTSSGGSISNVLLATNVPVTDFNACKRAFPTNWVDDTMMCAGYIGSNDRDSCQQDSGGPLAYKNGNAFELVGIVSWGIGCASETPGVYADVHVFENWITQTMK